MPVLPPISPVSVLDGMNDNIAVTAIHRNYQTFTAMNSEENSNTVSTMLLRALEANDMGETLKDRIAFTAPIGTKERLKVWAEAERRTISNLCEGVVLEALEQWELNQRSKPGQDQLTSQDK